MRARARIWVRMSPGFLLRVHVVRPLRWDNWFYQRIRFTLQIHYQIYHHRREMRGGEAVQWTNNAISAPKLRAKAQPNHHNEYMSFSVKQQICRDSTLLSDATLCFFMFSLLTFYLVTVLCLCSTCFGLKCEDFPHSNRRSKDRGCCSLYRL